MRFDILRDITFLAVAIRILLATLCGGVIGIEREIKRRPAGFRTHILICLGACMTTLTSEYIVTVLNIFTDVGRLGAQVVAGIGFIGAGAIVVSHRQRIKGLTTAAGLWATAIIGLCIGAGFYEGGVMATVLIILAELFFSKIEYKILKSTREINIYMEYVDKMVLERVLELYKETNTKVVNMTITRSEASKEHNACAIFFLRLDKKTDIEELRAKTNAVEGVIRVEEI